MISYIPVKAGDVVGVYDADRKLIGTVDLSGGVPAGREAAFVRVLTAREPTELRNEIPPRRWLTINEAAAHLAVSRGTVQALIGSGHIKAARLGPQIVRIDVAQLDGYMEELAASSKVVNLWSR